MLLSSVVYYDPLNCFYIDSLYRYYIHSDVYSVLQSHSSVLSVSKGLEWKHYSVIHALLNEWRVRFCYPHENWFSWWENNSKYSLKNKKKHVSNSTISM